MAKPQAEPRPKKPARQPAGIAAGRKRVDWEAVERDYRASQMTLREMGDKHGCTHGAIAQKAKKDGWSRDLTPAIQQATNAKLIEAALTTAVNGATQELTNTVLAVAEVNSRVILGHRSDLTQLRSAAHSLLHELTVSALLAEDQEILAQVLAGSGAEPVDEARARAAVQKALSIPSRVSSIKALVESFDKLHVGERRAFGIKDESEDDPKDKPQKRVLLEFIDAQVK